MSGKRTNHNQVWVGIASSLLLLWLSSIALPGNTESKNQNRQNQLPQSPNTGSPESDFSAGGTRGESTISNICHPSPEELVYLLGTENREFSLSSHPTFWFYFPQSVDPEVPINFVVKEAETDKTIYSQAIKQEVKPGIVGIALPNQKSYALAPETNYSWSLAIDCQHSDRDSDLVLTGWLQHQPADSEMAEQLATTPPLEKYHIYMEQNLLYDAVTQLAQARIDSPQNLQVKDDWQDLLSELGLPNLSDSKAIAQPRLLETNVSLKK